MDDLQSDVVGAELVQRIDQGLDGTLNIGLQDDIELLGSLFHPLIKLFQRDLRGDGELPLPLLPDPILPDVAGLFLVIDADELRAGLRNPRKADDFHRHRRPGLADTPALIVDHRPNPAEFRLGDERVPLAQRAFLNQYGRHRPPAPVQFRFDDHAAGRPGRIRFEFHDIGLQQDHLQKLPDPLSLLGRNLAKDRIAAPFLREQLVFGQGLTDLRRIGARFVHFIDGHDNGNSGHLGMVDRLHRLPHHAVVGGHHQNDDIRHLGPPGAHGREGLMARCIEENDVAPVDVDMIGADCLGNPSHLPVDHVRLPDGIQQGCLAVVHVTHDGHDRRPGLQIFRRGFGFLKGFVDDTLGGLDLIVEIGGNQRRRIEIDRLVDGHHQTQGNQFVDHIRCLDPHPLGQFADADRFVHPDPALDRLRRGDLGFFHLDRSDLLLFPPFCRSLFMVDFDLSALSVHHLLEDGFLARRLFPHQNLDGGLPALHLGLLGGRLPAGFFRSGRRRNSDPDILDDLQFRPAGDLFPSTRQMRSAFLFGRTFGFAGCRHGTGLRFFFRFRDFRTGLGSRFGHRLLSLRRRGNHLGLCQFLRENRGRHRFGSGGVERRFPIDRCSDGGLLEGCFRRRFRGFCRRRFSGFCPHTLFLFLGTFLLLRLGRRGHLRRGDFLRCGANCPPPDDRGLDPLFDHLPGFRSKQFRLNPRQIALFEGARVGFDRDADFLQPRNQLLVVQPHLLGQFVYSLLRHAPKSPQSKFRSE